MFSKNSAYIKCAVAAIIILSITLTGCSKAPSQKKITKPITQSKSSKPITYTSNVQPILAKNCVNCHKPKGRATRIPLDTYAHVMKYVKPKVPVQSRLINSINGGSMSNKLKNSNQKQVLINWVVQGAKK